MIRDRSLRLIALTTRRGPTTFPPSTMRTILISGTLCATLTAAFWYALTSSLTDMTRSDCRAGVERACLQLKKDGVRL